VSSATATAADPIAILLRDVRMSGAIAG
jgi:hypothetical protein